jgi:hypothetical protein
MECLKWIKWRGFQARCRRIAFLEYFWHVYVIHSVMSGEPTFVCITAVSKKQQVVAVKFTEGLVTAGCSSWWLLQFKGANQNVLETWYLWMEWVSVMSWRWCHFLLGFSIFHDEFVRSRAGQSFPLCTYDCCCQDIHDLVVLIETYFLKESCKYRWGVCILSPTVFVYVCHMAFYKIKF